MTEIYVIRHAQAEGNLYRVMQGHWDGGVTALGFAQIDALAERFKAVEIDAVYSSDLYRACATASAITRYHALPLVTDRELREINVGPLETQFFGDMLYRYPENMAQFMYDPEHWTLEGAETYSDVRERGYNCLRRIADANPGKTLAVVSHGVTIRAMMSGVTGISLNDKMNLPAFGNTSVTKLRYDGGVFAVEYMNDASHLDGLTPSWPRTDSLRCEYIDPAKAHKWYTHCYADAWKTAHGSLCSFNARTYLNSAIKHYEHYPRAVMKLYNADEPVGLVDLDTERYAQDGIGWVSLLYLAEEYRGKGYGAQALGRAVFAYRALGRKFLRLQVAGENENAVRFYLRFGFKTVSEQTTSLGTLLTMEKSLEEKKDV